MPIIIHSNVGLLIILIPNNGNELTIKGRTTQCMAQAIEVTIPKKSQLTRAFINETKIVNLQQRCNNFILL